MEQYSNVFKLTLIPLTFLFLASCGQRQDVNLGIKFSDSLNIYSDSFEKTITNGSYSFPNGIPILIKTTDSISDSQIGGIATLEFDDGSNWENWGDFKKTKQNGVLLFISKKPRLIQIRFGENLSLEANRAGLSFGTKYRLMQETFISQGYENGLQEVLKVLQKELPPSLELSWIMKMEKPAAKSVFNELSDLSTPSENSYTKFIFKPYSKLVHSVGLFNHPIVLVLINALLLLFIVKVGRVLIRKIFKKGRVTSIALIGWGIISSIFFSIPFWGSIIFLSSFRIEDTLFAKYLEIPLIPFASYPDWFSSYTQIWLAIIIGVLVLAVDFAAYYLGRIVISSLIYSGREEVERDIQENTDDVFYEASGRAFRFTIFALFMPRAISLLILFYYILKIPGAISDYIKLGKLNI